MKRLVLFVTYLVEVEIQFIRTLTSKKLLRKQRKRRRKHGFQTLSASFGAKNYGGEHYLCSGYSENSIEKWKFLQDGARAHTAKKSIKLIHELIGNRLHKHPAKSPEVNAIEDMWSYLDRKVTESRVTSIPSLKRKLKKESGMICLGRRYENQ